RFDRIRDRKKRSPLNRSRPRLRRSMFPQWSRRLWERRSPKRQPIGIRPAAKNGCWRTSFFFLFQTIGERLVSTKNGHPRSGAVGWLGNDAAKILSCRGSAARVVAGAQEQLLAGISEVPFGNKTAGRTQ